MIGDPQIVGLSVVKGRQARAQIAFAGEIIVREIELPEELAIYRGVWRRGNTYRIGDMVTHKGALWFCQSRGTACPGKNNQWKLICKSGEVSETFEGDDEPPIVYDSTHACEL